MLPQYISDKNSRNVTYCKRKRGLIKKAIELSTLCDQDIFMVVFDKQRQKMVQYSSTPDFDSEIVSLITAEDTRR